MNKFKAKRISIIVATDILSRGIDVEDISLVINYDIPHDGEDYIHRIGRTARGSNGSGTAYTFIAEREQKAFRQIEELLGKEVPKLNLPQHLGNGPSIYVEAAKGASKPSVDKGKKKFYKRK
jgi:ATP-dependent RNA helicase RhlE